MCQVSLNPGFPRTQVYTRSDDAELALADSPTEHGYGAYGAYMPLPTPTLQSRYTRSTTLATRAHASPDIRYRRSRSSPAHAVTASSQPRLADTDSASGVLVHMVNEIVRPGLHAIPDVGTSEMEVTQTCRYPQ